MRLTVQLELPDVVAVTGPNPSQIEIIDSEVRDPSTGVVGRAVGPGRLNWRDGRRYLEISIDLDDKLLVDAIQPFRSTF